MKRILSLFTAITLGTTGISGVVSCDVANPIIKQANDIANQLKNKDISFPEVNLKNKASDYTKEIQSALETIVKQTTIKYTFEFSKGEGNKLLSTTAIDISITIKYDGIYSNAINIKVKFSKKSDEQKTTDIKNKIKNSNIYIKSNSNNNTNNINTVNEIRNALKSTNKTLTSQETQYIGFQNNSQVLARNVVNDIVLKIKVGNAAALTITIKVTPSTSSNKDNYANAIKDEIINNNITIPNVSTLKSDDKIYTDSTKTNLKNRFNNYVKQVIRSENPYMTSDDISYFHIVENKEVTTHNSIVKIDWYKPKDTSSNISSNFNFVLSNNNKNINNIISDTKFDTYNNKEGNIYLPNLSFTNTTGAVEEGANLYNILFNDSLKQKYQSYRTYIMNALSNDKITLKSTGLNNDKDFLHNVEQKNEMRASESSLNEYKAFMNKAYNIYKNSTVNDIQTEYRSIRPQNNNLNLDWLVNSGTDTTNKPIMERLVKLNYGVFNSLFGKVLSSHIIKKFGSLDGSTGVNGSFSYNPFSGVSQIKLIKMNSQEYQKNVLAGYNVGWSGDYAYTHIMTHEYGHAFDTGLDLIAQQRSQLNFATESEFSTPISTYSVSPREYLVKYLDNIGHISPDNKNWSWLFANALVSSNYGRGARYNGYKGQPDLFAEAFAQWMYQPLDIDKTNGNLLVSGTGTNTSLKYKNISHINRGWEVLNNFFLNVLPAAFNLIPLNSLS